MPKAKNIREPSKRQIDWEAIYCEYRAGVHSVREIGTIFGVSHAAILKRAKKEPEKWQRDLTQRVRQAIARKMVTTEVTTADEDEIIAVAAQRSLEIIMQHRKSITRLADVEAELLAELQDNPLKLWIGQYMGMILTQHFPIPVTERSKALLALANTMSKRIQMERQAFGITDNADHDAEKITGITIIGVAALDREDQDELPKKIPLKPPFPFRSTGY
jgi:hypothetical protein